ncbi:MAG: glycosyltransferase, partial [Bacteroidia bacterium]
MAAIIKQQILFITSFPGRECGIATYSRDLIENLVRQFGSGMDFKICALEEGETEREYCQEVWTTFDTTNFNAYHQLATKINNSPEINVVVIQHEFGLFGGKNGVWILDFLQHLSKPVVTTFHTVLPDPDPERKQLVKAIADNSRHLLVMTKSSADILKSVYNIEGEKITVIPHGTHMVPWKGKAEMKKKYNVQDRLVLSTFGLISRNKGIETALDAMVGIKEQFPNVLYLILGKTHPGVVKHEGESYREYLQAKVDDLNLNANVKFVNKYLELNELLEYLTLTDIYLFTSIDPYQAVSGTFSYALGSACPVISTPIPHAIEMISDANGIIVDFRDPAQLKDAAVRLLADPVLRENMGKNAFHYMHKTIWQNVVIPHARIFESCNDHKDLEPLLFCLPEISLNHIRYLTTTAGIIQFSKICEPDIESGYTLDDNARALIAVSMLYAQQQDDAVLPLINTYLSFIEYCQQKNGSFLNYVDKHLQFTDANYAENLEDANGRAMWALGKFLSYHEIMPEDLLIRANKCIRKSLENVWQFQSPRAMAFAIKGLYFLSGYYENEKLRNAELLERLAEGLL